MQLLIVYVVSVSVYSPLILKVNSYISSVLYFCNPVSTFKLNDVKLLFTSVYDDISCREGMVESVWRCHLLQAELLM